MRLTHKAIDCESHATFELNCESHSAMTGGTVDGFQLLAPESIAELRRVQYPEVVDGQGFIWMYHR